MEVMLSELEVPSTSDAPVFAALAMRTWKSGGDLAFPAASRSPLHALLLQQLGRQHPAHRQALFCDPAEACELRCMPVFYVTANTYKPTLTAPQPQDAMPVIMARCYRRTSAILHTELHCWITWTGVASLGNFDGLGV